MGKVDARHGWLLSMLLHIVLIGLEVKLKSDFIIFIQTLFEMNV